MTYYQLEDIARLLSPETVTLTLPREAADALYELLGDTPWNEQAAWAWAPMVALADALGREVPAWVRLKATS